ncbi:MAG: ferric reductase-like transmembrane domain-containing protein [Verrucomicrobia bacterium]|nr:ferric reductase-like transmembrane domain-containing protein [Verrucomicrobiota bacterium]
MPKEKAETRTEKETEKRRQEVELQLADTHSRIRRYTLDPRLQLTREQRQPAAGTVPNTHEAPSGNKSASEESRKDDADGKLRHMADEAWTQWLEVRNDFVNLPDTDSSKKLNDIENRLLKLERNLDLLQRELIGEQSYAAGIRTVTWLAVTLILLVVIYLVTHGVRGLDLMTFEPWPEWGPLKYGEVAFWSLFGVLCILLFLATKYLARRDFDTWYQPWYVSTALRAPFLAIILMMVVLEFIEWYGEGSWLQTYLLEEGNKFYFIAFVSFCLGLSSNTTNAIMRDLSEGVSAFVGGAVKQVANRLGSLIKRVEPRPK